MYKPLKYRWKSNLRTNLRSYKKRTRNFLIAPATRRAFEVWLFGLACGVMLTIVSL